MISNSEQFYVEFTEQCIREMEDIYSYITYALKENKAAKRLMKEVNKRILRLSSSPELYMKIGKIDKLKREYHRMIVKNYIVIYTIDYDKKKSFYFSYDVWKKKLFKIISNVKYIKSGFNS